MVPYLLATAQAFCNLYGVHRPALQTPTVIETFDEYDGRALVAARCRFDRDGTALSAEGLKRLRQDQRGFQAYFADTLNRWLDGVYDSAPGVETWDCFYRRVANGIQQIMDRNGQGKRLALFTSGGPITAVVKRVLGLSPRTAVELGWQLMNASLTIIQYNNGRMALSQFNNTTQLLLERDAALMTYR